MYTKLRLINELSKELNLQSFYVISIYGDSVKLQSRKNQALKEQLKEMGFVETNPEPEWVYFDKGVIHVAMEA